MTGPIEVSVSVDDRDEKSAGSLYRWLTQDPGVRRDATVTPALPTPGAGEMGGALEVINVVLSNSIAIGSLVVAVCSWRGSRPRPPTVTVERDGTRWVIEDASPEAVRELREALSDRPAAPDEDHDDGAV